MPKLLILVSVCLINWTPDAISGPVWPPAHLNRLDIMKMSCCVSPLAALLVGGVVFPHLHKL
jgi:hypothetical protein